MCVILRSTATSFTPIRDGQVHARTTGTHTISSISLRRTATVVAEDVREVVVEVGGLRGGVK